MAPADQSKSYCILFTDKAGEEGRQKRGDEFDRTPNIIKQVISKSMTFENKVVLITGSSQGIGKALAKQLLLQGALVVLNGRNKTRLLQAVNELNHMCPNVAGLQGDVSHAEVCVRLIEETMRLHGQIDILVNNAGIAVGPETVENIKPEVYTQTVATNYLSAVYMTQAALTHIRKTQGSVLFVSSIAGLIGFPESTPYCSAKMALTGFAEALRWELLGSGVHTGIAYIGHTENEKNKKILAPHGGTMQKVHLYSIKLVPIQVMAANLLQMLKRRRFKAYYPFPARMIVYLQRYCPFLYKHLFYLFLLRETRRKGREVK